MIVRYCTILYVCTYSIIFTYDILLCLQIFPASSSGKLCLSLFCQPKSLRINWDLLWGVVTCGANFVSMGSLIPDRLLGKQK